jgi:predicted ester cyclase
MPNPIPAPDSQGAALTRAQMDAKLDAHFHFEATDNVEGVLATLTDEVEHDVVGWPTGPAHGRDGARPFYETLFADLADGKVETRKRYYGADFMVDESLWSGRAVGQPFGLEGRDRPLSFRLLHIIEFSGEGDIKRENVWLDLASIMQQLPQS